MPHADFSFIVSKFFSQFKTGNESYGLAKLALSIYISIMMLGIEWIPSWLSSLRFIANCLGCGDAMAGAWSVGEGKEVRLGWCLFCTRYRSDNILLWFTVFPCTQVPSTQKQPFGEEWTWEVVPPKQNKKKKVMKSSETEWRSNHYNLLKAMPWDNLFSSFPACSIANLIKLVSADVSGKRFNLKFTETKEKKDVIKICLKGFLSPPAKK